MSALSPRRLSLGAAAGLLILLAGSESPSVAQTAAPRPALPVAARPTPPAPVAMAQAATPPRPVPRRRTTPRTYARPTALTTVQSANSSARDYPSAGAYVNAALYYDFEPGRLYTVHTSPRFLTAISLRPGEIILEPLRQQPANRKQVNPGFYEVVDLTLGEKSVTTLSVTEGAELTLTTDGSGTNYACPR